MRQFSTPPLIETARLIIDGHTAADFEALAALWAAPDTVRHIGGRPSTRQESWQRLLRYCGTWPLLGYGYWAIRTKADGRYIGDLGFHDMCRAIDPPIFGTPEAGWVFARAGQGQGFAGEALAAALSWLDAQGHHPRSVCLISPANAPSIRLAEKHGYARHRTVSYMNEETLLLTRGPLSTT